jgi:hypothetical protein
MKKSTDRNILKKSDELRGKQVQKATTLTDFRKQFQHYQRAKRGGQINLPSVCRPYIEVFHQPEITQGT